MTKIHRDAHESEQEQQCHCHGNGYGTLLPLSS
jgi:hypothetical protein